MEFGLLKIMQVILVGHSTRKLDFFSTFNVPKLSFDATVLKAKVWIVCELLPEEYFYGNWLVDCLH